MGEYATYRGESIKIGTCENMYYLRADQRHLISGYRFELDVERFRFPFPDEDHIEPGGAFEDHSRGVRVPGYSLPAELSGDEHGSVQFTSSAGYVLSIPCPEQYGQPGLRVDLGLLVPPGGCEGVETAELHVGRNGFRGHPVVRQQAFRGGHLVTLLSCNACGALHRLDTLEDAAPVIQAFRAEAERQEYRRDLAVAAYANSDRERANLNAIADRIEAGYLQPPELLEAYMVGHA